MTDYYFTSDEIDAVKEYLESNKIVCSLCTGSGWKVHEINPEVFQLLCSNNSCKQRMHRNVLKAAITSAEDEQRIEYEESFKTDDGKVKAGVLQDFSRALMEVAKVGTMGIDFKGYSRGSWLDLPDAEERYLDAFWRHLLDTSEYNEEDGGVLISAQIAWNALAKLELTLRRKENKND